MLATRIPSGTRSSSIACTTCAAVMTLPSREMSTPDPISLKRTSPLPETSWPVALMTTTAGLTLRKVSPTVCAAIAYGKARTMAAVPTRARVPRLARRRGISSS